MRIFSFLIFHVSALNFFPDKSPLSSEEVYSFEIRSSDSGFSFFNLTTVRASRFPRHLFQGNYLFIASLTRHRKKNQRVYSARLLDDFSLLKAVSAENVF
jgi:hypothetical protein